MPELAGVGRNGAPVAGGERGRHRGGEGKVGKLTEASAAVGRRRRRRATAGKKRRRSAASRGCESEAESAA